MKSINKLAHNHGVYVSTGGWIENVLRFGPQAVDRYIEEAKALDFDVIELSAGFISLPTDSLLRLVEKVRKAGLKAKPELGIQFGAGGATAAGGSGAAGGTGAGSSARAEPPRHTRIARQPGLNRTSIIPRIGPPYRPKAARASRVAPRPGVRFIG